LARERGTRTAREGFRFVADRAVRSVLPEPLRPDRGRRIAREPLERLVPDLPAWDEPRLEVRGRTFELPARDERWTLDRLRRRGWDLVDVCRLEGLVAFRVRDERLGAARRVLDRFGDGRFWAVRERRLGGPPST